MMFQDKHKIFRDILLFSLISMCFPGRVGMLTLCFRLKVAVTAGEPRARCVDNQNQRASQQQVLLKFYETTAYVGLESYV